MLPIRDRCRQSTLLYRHRIGQVTEIPAPAQEDAPKLGHQTWDDGSVEYAPRVCLNQVATVDTGWPFEPENRWCGAPSRYPPAAQGAPQSPPCMHDSSTPKPLPEPSRV